MSNLTEKTCINNADALKEGTLLADRYEIKRKVGRGGFSIVYDAVDIRTGRRVAVKECTIPSEKDRFLREARLLEDFAGEEAVVTVIDFFDESGTAYIVMEYLEGETLRSNIERNGRWDIEDAVRRMSPVMKTLGRMHKKGVIHRDISPDNLMVMDDGRLVLLDFGAARQYEDSTLSRLVVKASYSPPEQMDAKGIFGSWSDVYSVCAAIYFCVTGTNPEDAISRLMLDELKKPSELGAKILPAAEKTLMNGMALDSKERIKSMEQLMSELEKAYPPLTPEEKHALKRKKRNRILAAAATAAVAAVIALVIINMDAICAAYHHKTGTETIILDGTGMDDEEFEANAAKAEARIDALSGGKARHERIGHTIAMEIPADISGDTDPVKWADSMISVPLELLVSEFAEGRPEISAGHLHPAEDIESFDEAGGIVTIKFSETGRRRFGDILSEEGVPLVIRGDESYGHMPDFYIDGINEFIAENTGDGMTVTIEPRPGYLEYARQLFTEEPLSGAFATTAVMDVSWEDPGRSEDPGYYQVSEKELRKQSPDGTALLLKYRVKSDAGKSASDNKKSASAICSGMNHQMDMLEIPYAIGRGQYDKSLIIVEVPGSSLSIKKAALLGRSSQNGHFHIGGAKTRYFDTFWWLSAVRLSDSENGADAFPLYSKAEPEDLNDKKQLLDYLESLKKEGEDDLYLYYDNIPFAKSAIDDAIAAVESDKDLAFKDWCNADGMKDDLKEWFDCTLSFTGLEEFCFLEDVQNIDRNGNISCNKTPDILFEAEQRAGDYVSEWNRRYEGALKFDRTLFGCDRIFEEADYGKSLYIRDASAHKSAEEAIEDFCEFYSSNKAKLEDGTFKDIHYGICGRYIDIYMDAGNRYYIASIPSFTGVDGKEIISKNSELKHLITSETSVW